MPATKITPTAIKKAHEARAMALAADPATAYRDTLRDSAMRGLALVINRTSESWIYSYKPGGSERIETSPGNFAVRRPPTRHVKLGTLDSLSPDEARAKAAELKLQVIAKQDPAADLRAAQKSREATTKRSTNADLIAPYERHLSTVTSRKTRRRLGERHVAVEIANLKALFAALNIADITPTEINADHVNEIPAKAAGSTAARHWHGALVRFLNWCLSQKRISHNPARDVPLPPAPPSRNRWLSGDEIKAVWAATHATEMEPVYGSFTRWLIAIPARRNEAANMRWPAIDITNAVWSQSEGDVKNAQPHRFHIHDIAMEIINERLDASRQPGETREAAYKRLKADNALVFPSPRATTPISTFSSIIAKLHDASGATGWSFHDFRRSFASHLGEAGQDIGVVDQVLNHAASGSRAGVLAVYQRSARWPAQIATTKVWATMLGKFTGHAPATESANVVTMTKKAK